MLVLPRLQVEGQSEAVPVPFRYDVKPAASKRTIIYRPNSLQGEPRAATLGAIWAGKYDKLPSSKLIDVVWEVLRGPFAKSTPIHVYGICLVIFLPTIMYI